MPKNKQKLGPFYGFEKVVHGDEVAFMFRLKKAISWVEQVELVFNSSKGWYIIL